MKHTIYIVFMIFVLGMHSQHNTAHAPKKIDVSVFIDEELNILNSEVIYALGTPGEIQAIQKLNEAAIRKANPLYESLTYYYHLYLCRCNLQIKEASGWLQHLDRVARRNQFYQLLFEGRKIWVEINCIRGDLGVALLEAKSMHDEASKLEHLFCETVAKQSMAIVYLASGQYHEGQDILQSIESFPDQTDGWLHNIRKTTYLLSIETYLELNELDNADLYFQNLLQELNKKTKEEQSIFAEKLVDTDIWFHYHSLYARYCLQKNELSKIKSHLTHLDKIVHASPYVSYQILWHKIKADYYKASGQPGPALLELDKELSLLKPSFRYYQKAIHKKAELYKQLGQDQQAYDTYQLFINIQDSVEQASYIRQINLFKAKFEADQNEIANQQLRLKSHTLFLLIFFLIFFIVILCILIWINKRLKKKLIVAKEKSERSDRLKSAFLANMNHEIRTPLNAIAGFSQLLADETDPEMSEQYIHIIRGNNDLLINLLNDVLDISKIESGTLSFTYSEVHLPTLINELYETVRLQVNPPVQLLKEQVPELYLYTDRNRLIQILSNLLSNAIKHTTQGSIQVGYEPVGPDQVRFYVTDTGKGIKKELQEHIFARFVQAVETHSKGVGLGLALCKGFIDHMGGEIGVISEEGKGSTFWFLLPGRQDNN